MRGVTAQRLRRRRPGAAAAVYSHALAVLGDPDLAQSVAVTALKRGAHSRVAVFAHARYQTLQYSERAQRDDSSVSAEVSPDLRDVAGQLARTRPAIERAVVDLELRYGLDPTSFARVLGVSNERASARSESIIEAWSTTLDPALMAWMGPGSCSGLTELLESHKLWPRAASMMSAGTTGPVPIVVLAPTGTDTLEAMPSMEPVPGTVTIAELVTAAPDVAAHAEECDVCEQRLRMMTSVRTLLGNLPAEAVPPVVAEAAHSARRRLAGPLPPSIEPRRLEIQRLRSVGMAAGCVAVVGLACWGIFAAQDGSSDTQAKRVERLVETAPTSRLLGTPTIITPATKTAALANNGPAPINWKASTSAPWLTVSPTEGRLNPSQTISIVVKTTGTPAANTASDATVSIVGDDGSKQTLRYDPNGG